MGHSNTLHISLHVHKESIAVAYAPSYTSTEPLISNTWYHKTANTTIAMTSTEFANPSYVLGYICTWTGRAWKYGYRDSACTQS